MYLVSFHQSDVLYTADVPFLWVIFTNKDYVPLQSFQKGKTTKRCPGVVKRLTCVPGQPRRVITSSVGGHTFYSDPSLPPKTVQKFHLILTWRPMNESHVPFIKIFGLRDPKPWPRDDQSGQTICLIGQAKRGSPGAVGRIKEVRLTSICDLWRERKKCGIFFVSLRKCNPTFTSCVYLNIYLCIQILCCTQRQQIIFGPVKTLNEVVYLILRT